MEEINIVFTDEASSYLDDLIQILYRKEYFGFVESAEIYVSDIYYFIKDNIKDFPNKKTPSELQNLGTNYIFIKLNLEQFGTSSLKNLTKIT
ncbi:hypothetical protein [Flavobacterium sp.]|uniref:hypothetical protein n=1 Tax=Flavobacterium sp. TaxID=239 RepID=UPI00286AF146|nr:hypothetical protein [Flavobacterium sp.]